MARKEITDKLSIYIPDSKIEQRPVEHLLKLGRKRHMGIVRKLCHKVLISLFVLCASFAQYGLGQVIYVERTEFSSHFEFSCGSPLLTIPVVFLLWSLLPLIICYRAAGRKGKSRGLWMLLAIIFGWIAVLVIAASASER